MATQRPAALPSPWATTLTCPECHEPEALVLFDGVGTVCRECGESTRILIDPEEVP
jgi:hypothetical protein